MDKDRFSWMPALMPGVAQLVIEKRQQYGKAWVAECWRRSVHEGQAGWFFAWEGPLVVGTPPDDVELMAMFAALPGGQRKAMVLMRTPEVPRGA